MSTTKEEKPEQKDGALGNCTQIWFSNDTGRHYRIIETMGSQKVCNQNGILQKPFDPNLTGQFNYTKRLKIMQNQNPDEKVQVELPKSLKSNHRRNYSPQNDLLEGYSQMPRALAPPYKNNEENTRKDFARRKRSMETNQFFKHVAQSIPRLERSPQPTMEGSMTIKSSGVAQNELPAIQEAIQQRKKNKSQVGIGAKTTKNSSSSQSTYFTDQWNKSYAQKLAERGPRGHKAMNQGTSYLVASIPHTNNDKIKRQFKENNSFLQGQNQMYIKLQNPEDETIEDGEQSPQISKKKKQSQAGRKSPSQIKTEYLAKLFAHNERGEKKVIHERELKSPNPFLTKKLDQNHFTARHGSVTNSQAVNRKFDNDLEKFDDAGAATLMQSKHTQSKLNQLFVDTRVFNLSSNEYLQELSQPGAVEYIDAQLDKSPKGADLSIFSNTLKHQVLDFSKIRGNHKVSTYVSQMASQRSLFEDKTSYNKSSKACIPSYNIKASYNQHLTPFFSPEKKKKVQQTIQEESMGSPEHDATHESQGKFSKKKQSVSVTNGSTKQPILKEQLSDPNLSAMASQVTISQVHIDPEQLAVNEEEQEVLHQLHREKLPGTVKTKWALRYKLGMDKAIEDALTQKEVAQEKVKTKGRFVIQAHTNAGNWIKDRSWAHSANPSLKAAEIAREEHDILIMSKRYEQKLIQNQALEQQYKIVVKKPKN